MLKLYKAEYDGRECMAREVSDPLGEHVVTYDGNVFARPGDYVVSGLIRAPRGYKSTSIDKVVRAKDNRLVLGEEIAPPEPEDDAQELMEPDNEFLPPVKSASSKRAQPTK